MAPHLKASRQREIRERYRELQEIDAGSPENERLTLAQLDHKVAREFSVSPTTVQNLVMGLTHPEAGGPIDTERRERRDLYVRERQSIGPTEARRRLQLRARGQTTFPSAVTERLALRVTVMDSRNRPTVASVTLAPGEWLRTELVPQALETPTPPNIEEPAP